MGQKLIDLYSDTQTQPTAAMRKAIAEAEVGDEQKGEDPTVSALQEEVARLLGKEAALYLPSATMANQIAVKLHTRPGDEIILDQTSHLIQYEAGGPAFHSGVMTARLQGPRGIFTAEAVAAAIRPRSVYAPVSRMVSIENTTNRGGGAVWPLAEIERISAVARANDIRMHLDGSRLMHAAVASGESAARLAAPFDTVTFCLSKGLGAPVGALIAGSREPMTEARRYKQIFGGAMRQAGIIAAAGLHAVRHHVGRLADDHRNARTLASLLASIPGIRIDVNEVETNIIIFHLPEGVDTAEFRKRIEARGVRMSMAGPAIRAITHLDIREEDLPTAADAVAAALAEMRAG